MRTLQNYFGALLICLGIFASNNAKAQSPCTSLFSYTINPAGNVTFNSISTTTSSTSAYNWLVFNTTNGMSIGSMSGLNPSFNFSVNGTYSITLVLVNNSPACSAFSGQTLAITNTNVPCTLNADFSVTQGVNGAVTLNNITSGTSGGVTYAWAFGDNTTGTSTSPAHTYAADGVYSVTLTANNNYTYNCSSTKVKNVQICTVNPMVPSYIYSLNPGGNVTFTSTSTNTTLSTYYTWQTSYNGWGMLNIAAGVNLNQSNYTYTVNGNYGITLTITNSLTNCSYATTQSITVTSSSQPCNLNAYFTASQGTSGQAIFSNQSFGTVPGTTYQWNFGDGSTSTIPSPTHVYANDGPYVVTLFANNNFTSSCASTYASNIKICTNAPMSSSFLYTLNGSSSTFTSTSTGVNSATLYNWSTFPLSNQWQTQNLPSGVNVTQSSANFNTAGTHVVQLNVVNPVSTCNSISTQSIVVTTTCLASALFTVTPTGVAQVWNATPASPVNVTAASWSWGDGSSTNSLYTSHTYSAAGTYSICLSVTVACGAVNSYCLPYYIFKNSQSNEVIQINVIDPATVSIKDHVTLSGMSVSPNPASDLLIVKLAGFTNDPAIHLFDLTGKLIYYQKAVANNGDFVKEINLTETPAGIYLLKVSAGDKSLSKKIIVEK